MPPRFGLGRSDIAQLLAASSNKYFSRHFDKKLSEKVLDLLGVSSVVQLEIVRNPAALGIATPPGVVPSGGTGNGKVHLFTDNIADESECFRVIFHELFHLEFRQSVSSYSIAHALPEFQRSPF